MAKLPIDRTVLVPTTLNLIDLIDEALYSALETQVHGPGIFYGPEYELETDGDMGVIVDGVKYEIQVRLVQAGEIVAPYSRI